MNELRNHSSDTRSRPTVLLGNKMDVDEMQRRVPYLTGSDLAYEFGVDYFESTCTGKEDTEKMRKETEELEMLFEGKVRETVKNSGDKIDTTGDPDKVVQQLIRRVLKQLPKSSINIGNIDEEYNTMSIEALSLLAIPAQSILGANLKLHRPLYMALPEGFTDLRLKGQEEEIVIDKRQTPEKTNTRDTGALAATLSAMRISALSLGDKSMGDFLIDDGEDDIGGGGGAHQSEYTTGPYEARIQYQKKAAQMRMIDSIASTTVDWM
jgi:hypothetical protein